MRTNSDAGTDAGTGSEVVGRPINQDVLAIYEAGFLAIPEAGGEGMEHILEAVARSMSPRQLSAPWEGEGLAKYRDQAIVVHSLRKMRSEYDGPLGWFLILDCASVDTGETFTAMTGSISIVAQLVIAHQNGWMPLRVIPRLAKRPTADGFYPMHLDVLSSSARKD